jgi:glycosyltransferase involved in cell wall biosynthesis
MLQSRPRILFVDQQGEVGGAELSLLDIASAYRSHCTVAVFSDGPFHTLLREAGIDTRVLGAHRALMGTPRDAGPLKSLGALPTFSGLVGRLARLARSHDLLYANTQKSALAAAIAGQLARRPVIWHLRDILTAPEFGSFARRVVINAANLGITRVIANSEATRRAFVELGGRPERACVIHNGLRFVPRSDNPGHSARLRAELGMKNKPLIGLFGRISPWKGQEILVDALTRLPDAHAILVGQPFPHEPECLDRLRRHIAERNMTDRVHFLGFRSDVSALMEAVDIVVHASTSPEPFGRVIVEAMLAHRPVIATRGGGVVEILEHDVTGMLVPPSDPQALADALGVLLGDEAHREHLAEAGYQHATRHFTLDAMMKDISCEIADVLASGVRRGNTQPSATEIGS